MGSRSETSAPHEDTVLAARAHGWSVQPAGTRGPPCQGSQVVYTTCLGKGQSRDKLKAGAVGSLRPTLQGEAPKHWALILTGGTDGMEGTWVLGATSSVLKCFRE